MIKALAFDRGLAQCDQGRVAYGMLWMARALALAPSEETAMRQVIRENLNAWCHELHSLEAIFPHNKGVINVAISPSGELILTASKDKSAQLWSAQTGERVGQPM